MTTLKRLLCALLTLILIISCTAVAEEIEIEEPVTETEETQTYSEADGMYVPSAREIALGGRVIGDEPTHITVGNSTKVNGMFFTTQFGNNTSDIDVRAMIHGYNPIVWESQTTFTTDDTVVKALDKSTDKNGNTVYKFTIAEDLTWNDETPITAADYVFSYLLLASDEFSAISGDADVWEQVLGSEAYRLGETEYYAGIRLLDKYSFSVTVQKEYLPYFYELSYLSIAPCPIFVIAPGCEVADSKDGAYIRNIDETIEEPIFTADLLKKTILNAETGYLSHPSITCGPYNLVSYDRNTGVVEFEMNEYYNGNYDGVKPVITYVTLVPVLPQNMAKALETGEVDLINKVVDGKVIMQLMQLCSGVSVLSETEQAALAAKLAGEDEEPGEYSVRGLDRMNYARLGYGYISLACEQGPQQFKKVRQALAYAFDSDTFIREYLLGFGLAVKGYYGLGQWMTQVAVGNMRPQDLTAEQEAIWDSFTLDGLNDYKYDLNTALALLIEDGWTLNEKGEPFDKEVDKIRYKKLDDESLMKLSFTYGLTQDNEMAQAVLEMLEEAKEQLNMEIIVKTVPFTEILKDHLRDDSERLYDMSFLATNFVSVFDPAVDFNSDQENVGSQNANAVVDEKLVELAWDLHTTESGDVQTFEENWIEFQTCYNDLLPTVPIYSNVYFDFFSNWLQNYEPQAEANWPLALLYAYWAEPVEEEVEETDIGEEVEEDGEDIEIID